MPFDPRRVSKGGNRTTTRNDLKAPKGKYRVVLVDTFDGGDCILGNRKSKEKAIELAKKHGDGKQMTLVHVYDDKGKCIHTSGSF